jgi:hypothetical protein
MNTISPEESKAYATKVTEAGGKLFCRILSRNQITNDFFISIINNFDILIGVWIEAPVLGAWPVAEKAALQIMVGCPEQKYFDDCVDVLSCFGTPKYMGKGKKIVESCGDVKSNERLIQKLA